jgi:Co/Zn/Cd efflux system component
MYAERTKAKYGELTPSTKRMLEVYIPSFSVAALIGVTIYITIDAISVLRGSGDDDEVNVYFLWAFSVGNFVVDIISSLMFYWRGKDAFVSHSHDHGHAPLRTFSLDRRSIDMGKRHVIPMPPNLNMLSAITHVGGDTLRTTSVFIAAAVSTAANVPGNITDAWAAIVVSISIFICVIPLCKEIYKAASESPAE